MNAQENVLLHKEGGKLVVKLTDLGLHVVGGCMVVGANRLAVASRLAEVAKRA